MPKRKIINALPHNLTKSYFSTLRFYGSGYMADWIIHAARKLEVDNVILDIINSTIDPNEMEKLPLMFHLKDLKNMLRKELLRNGFDENFISEAKIKVQIPDRRIYSQTLYCYPELIDKDGRHYSCGRIIETAYEREFDPFVEGNFRSSILARFKRIFKFHK